MDIGWLTTALPNITDTYFLASLTNNPSSTKAELVAILTALLVVAPNATVTIYTDSQSVISTFHNYITSTIHMSTRAKEKVPNYQLWNILCHIISTNALKVNLIKVKDHSDDFLNNIADSLAKKGTTEPLIEINLLYSPYTNILLRYNNVPVEGPVRHFFKNVSYA